jgi:hypothetical protein
MNSSGSVSDASVFKRAPVPERSSIRHVPKMEPSARAILAPLCTDLRVLFLDSERINVLNQNWIFHHPAIFALCNAGGGHAAGAAVLLEADWRTCQNRRTLLALFWDNL